MELSERRKDMNQIVPNDIERTPGDDIFDKYQSAKEKADNLFDYRALAAISDAEIEILEAYPYGLGDDNVRLLVEQARKLVSTLPNYHLDHAARKETIEEISETLKTIEGNWEVTPEIPNRPGSGCSAGGSNVPEESPNAPGDGPGFDREWDDDCSVSPPPPPGPRR